MKAYASAVKRQIAGLSPEAQGRKVDSVYIGGGTPSILPPELLLEILEAAKKHFAEAIAAEKEQKKRIYTAVKTAEKKIHAAYLHKIKIIKTTYTIKHFLPDTLALIFSLGWIPATLYVIWWR